MKRHPQSGFTYLELLTSLALMALLAVLLSGSMTHGRQIWARAQGYDVLAAQATLRGKLHHWLHETEHVDLIKGDPKNLEFTVHFVDMPRPDIFALAVKISERRNRTDNEVIVTMEGMNIDDQVVFEETRVLASNTVDFKISYYGRMKSGAQARWHDAWPLEAKGLKLIKIETSQDLVQTWPPFVVAVGSDIERKIWDARSLMPRN